MFVHLHNTYARWEHMCYTTEVKGGSMSEQSQDKQDTGFWVEYVIDTRKPQGVGAFLPEGYALIRFECETGEDIDVLREGLRKVKKALFISGG